MLMICTAVVLVVVSIVVVAMTIIFRDPELYMCHFVYLAKDLFICCINPYMHLHYNPTVSHYFSFISKAHVSVQKGIWKVLTLSTKLVLRSVPIFQNLEISKEIIYVFNLLHFIFTRNCNLTLLFSFW